MGVRTPNSVELEWADKQLWGKIASLLEKGWTSMIQFMNWCMSLLLFSPTCSLDELLLSNIPARHGGQGKGDWGSGKSSAGRGRGGKKGGKSFLRSVGSLW